MLGLRRKTARAIAAIVVAGSGAAGLAGVAASSAPAHADPSFNASSVVAVGSDTIQDVFDAFAGQEPASPNPGAVGWNPLQFNTASGSIDIASFDAIPYGAGVTAATPSCIITRFGGPQFDRPNGSSDGATAVLDATSGTNWLTTAAGHTSCTGAPGVNISGQIDVGRSSRGPKTGSGLTFIPFGRDGLTYAYFDHGANVLGSLTTAQLQLLYGGTVTSITASNGDTVYGCLPNAGSGTRSFWVTTAMATTDDATHAQVSANAAPNGGCNGSVEENGGNNFYAYASGLAAGVDVVVPFSAAQWIAQANGVQVDRSATGRTASPGIALGAPDGLAPTTGTAPTLAPSTTFYNSSTYGRNVYVVAPTAKVTGLGASATLKGLFVGATSQICSAAAQTTVNKFGFDSLNATTGTCGSTTQTGV